MLILHDYELVTNTEASRLARACLRTALKLKLVRETKHDILKTLALFSEEQFVSELRKEPGETHPSEEEETEREKDNAATKAVEELYFTFERKFPGVNNLRQLCKDVLPEKMGFGKRRSVR